MVAFKEIFFFASILSTPRRPKGGNIRKEILEPFSKCPSDKRFEITRFAPPIVSGSSSMIANMMILKGYMVVNFKAREISRDARKLTRTLTLIKTKKEILAIKTNVSPNLYREIIA